MVRSFFLVLCFLAGTSSVSALEILEGEEWMGIYFKGKKLGFSNSVVSIADDGYRVDSRVYFRLYADGMDQVTSFTQKTELFPDLSLKSFSLLQEIMGSRHQTTAHLKGDSLTMDVTSSGFRRERKIRFKSGAILSSTFGLNIISEGLEVGRKEKRPIFMEALRTFSEIEYWIQGRHKVDFDGKIVEAFVVHSEIAGMESIIWLAPNGTVLREISQDGFESIRESKQKAQDMDEETISVSSLITMSLIKPEHEIENPRKVKKLKVKLINLRTRSSIPEDQRQILLDSKRHSEGWQMTLLVKSEALEIAETRSMDYFVNPSMLEDTSEIQSNHPMIKALAREIVSNEGDAWQTAQGINEWVYRNLEKVFVETFTAVGALKKRKGECQSHTNLFVALARASGIPARVVNGLVYSSQYKGFLYYAWPEVYVGGWRAMDPTLGQNSVDATHIKLGVGDQQAPLRLMEFIGKLQIRLLED